MCVRFNFDEWKGRAKSLAAVGLMLSAVWPVVEVALTVHRFRADQASLAEKAVRIAENLETTTANLKEASLYAKTSAQHFNDVFEIEANLLKQPGTQESIGLFFRSGDDAARLMDKFNRLADKTTTTVDHFNTRTHPLIDGILIRVKDETLVNVNAILVQADKTIVEFKDRTLLTIDETSATIKALRALIESDDVVQIRQKLLAIAANLEDVSGSGKLTAQSVQLATAEFEHQLPAIVDQLRRTATNTGDITEQAKIFVASFNEKDTKLKKFLRYLLQAAIISVPYLRALNK